jgi:CspA family cold shock protein
VRDVPAVASSTAHADIAPDGGGDVFVHIKAVQNAGFNGLVEGAKVDFDFVDNRGKQAAENLRVR